MGSIKARTVATAFGAFALLVSAVGLAAGSLPPGGSFTDDDGNVHEANIEAIAAEGITLGCNPPTNDMFCPNDTVTREQMATFLTRALDLPPAAASFVDTGNSVHEANIGALAAAGITKGCNPPTNDMFCPGSAVTREQMATFLTRALDLPPAAASFVDTGNSVHEANIGALAAAGITRGCNPPTNDMFCPGSAVTRAQMATFLTRALDLTPIVPPPPSSTTTTTIPQNPGDAVNCSDFDTWAEAQAWFDTYYPYYGDVANLDSDGDLIACESLPGAPGDHPRSGDGWEWLDCSGTSGTCSYPQGTAEAQVKIENKLLPPEYCLPDPIEPWRCLIEYDQWRFLWFDSGGTQLTVVGSGCSYQYNGGFLTSVTCFLPLADLAIGEYRGDLCRTEYPSSTCVEDLLSVYFLHTS
ncbi:MAG: excalibur calcium-binding domain-containing protein [Acidimicrobiia bacterium]|nr:excalibur calcium-binding domain-containing protein [Acidimicrobiia bacterium]